MGFFVCVGDPALDLAGLEFTVAPFVQRVHIVLTAPDRVGEVAEKRRRRVAGLAFALGEIDALREQAARRSGLEAGDLEAEFAQAIAEGRDGVAEPAAGLVSQADMEQTAHESAGGNDHRGGVETQAQIGFHALDAVVADGEARDIRLLDVEARLALEQRLHAKLVGLLVALRARGADARAFGGVEHAELDARGVGVEAHRAAEGVDFANHVAFCQPANRGVAGHLPDGVGVLGQEERFATETRRGHSRLDARVAGPDDDDIVVFRINEIAQVTRSRCRARRASARGLRGRV